MSSMSGKDLAESMKQYQNSLEVMSAEAVEYIRGVPVVKTFGQTVFSFKRFKEAIDEYEKWTLGFTKKMRKPMVGFTTAVNSIFVFIIIAAYLFGGHEITAAFGLNLLFYIIITPISELESRGCIIMSIKERLKHKYALSEQGANDMIKAVIVVTIANLAFMFPVGLLYLLASDILAGGIPSSKLPMYIVGMVVSVLLIIITTYFQYNATFLATYVESGIRRRTLAEKLRKIPLSFFGKKDLSDLTSTIMGDCAWLETASSHFFPQLFGSMCSTTIVTICLFFFNVKMTLAAVWVLPVAFFVVFGARPISHRLNENAMKYKLECQDGIQEGLETVRDLKSYNATSTYMIGENGSELSGGERQRISIARAFLKDAPIILMDEATASLDVDNESLIQEALSKLIKDKTVLIIAHRMRTVDGVDKIVVLKDGVVAENGTPDELKAADGIYRHMVDLQLQAASWKL